MSQEQQRQEAEVQDLGKQVTDAARIGVRSGFTIKMGRHGKKTYDPLSGEDVPDTTFDSDNTKTYHRQSMSTHDYKRYLDAKDKLAKETDDTKRMDLTLRMYEYLALKFLGMNHEEFVDADFDDVVVAVLACDALFGSGNINHNNNNNSPAQQQPRIRKKPIDKIDNYYKAPDEY